MDGCRLPLYTIHTPSTVLPLLATTLLATKLSLIALCDEDKLDPGVEWTEDYRKQNAGKILLGRNQELYSLWREAKSGWDQRQREMAANVPPPTDNEDGWFLPEFKKEVYCLGLATAGVAGGAATAFFVAGVSLSAFPIVAVGRAIWEAIRQWMNSFDASTPPELNSLYKQSKSVLGSMVKQLDTRMKDAKEIRPINPEEEMDGHDGEQSRLRGEQLNDAEDRVKRLETLLLHDARSMANISQSTEPAGAKMEKMTKLLRRLHKFERDLYNDGLLEEVLSKLQNILDDDSRRGAPPQDSTETPGGEKNMDEIDVTGA